MREGYNPLFFLENVEITYFLTNLFPHSLLREYNYDAFNIAFKFANGKFSLEIIS